MTEALDIDAQVRKDLFAMSPNIRAWTIDTWCYTATTASLTPAIAGPTDHEEPRRPRLFDNSE